MKQTKEYFKEYSLKNKEKRNKVSKAWYTDNNEYKKDYQAEYHKQNPAKSLFLGARHRARKLGLEFSIEVCDIPLPIDCPILGIPLNYLRGKGRGCQRDSATLDRIDSSGGYTTGNVWVISGQANRIKTNASKEELIKFAQWVLDYYD